MSSVFKRTLAAEWIKYVVVIVLSAAFWVIAFGLYHAPKANETIELFFAGKVLDHSFAELAEKSFPEIKKVEITSCDPSENTFYHKYSVVGLNGGDIVLVPLSVAEKTDCEATFLPLTGFGEPYEQKGKVFGIFLSDAAITFLSNYFKFGNERYVLFVVASSVNAGKLNDHAISFAKWMVEYV